MRWTSTPSRGVATPGRLVLQRPGKSSGTDRPLGLHANFTFNREMSSSNYSFLEAVLTKIFCLFYFNGKRLKIQEIAYL